MTAQDDLKLLRRGYEAFGKGDMPAVLEILAEDIVWHVPGRSPLSGDYEGHEAVMGFFGKIQELSGGSFRLEMHDMLASPDHVVALCSEHGQRNDRALDAPSVHVWHLRDGKATEFWGMTLDLYATDEFWS